MVHSSVVHVIEHILKGHPLCVEVELDFRLLIKRERLCFVRHNLLAVHEVNVIKDGASSSLSISPFGAVTRLIKDKRTCFTPGSTGVMRA